MILNFMHPQSYMILNNNFLVLELFGNFHVDFSKSVNCKDSAHLFTLPVKNIYKLFTLIFTFRMPISELKSDYL